MSTDNARLEEVAGAILDGEPIEWSTAGADDGSLPLIPQLKIVAAIADVHRGGPGIEEWAHLRILERIGSGSFGEVFRAWDTRLDREVALKLLPASEERDSSSIIREGRLLARVRHPNVVTIYGAERIDDRIGLWMELVPGRTLEAAIQAQALAATEIVRIGVELSRAVSAVHRAGLLHRDIKAHNVMLADDGRVLLMDFGTGREIDDPSTTDLAGTPLYLATEVLLGGAATARSDIYSLGILLYRLVSRSYPVHAGGRSEPGVGWRQQVRATLQSARPDVPAALARVIERAIDPRPEQRYESAEAMAEGLSRVARHRGSLATVYAVAASAAIVLVSWMGAALGGRPSVDPAHGSVVAVLPFENLGADPGSAEFADGFTYEIHRNLAAIDGLDLRGSTSSFEFRDRPRDLREIGEQLAADYLLEGSILQDHDRVRVTVRLGRVADGTTVWADTFDGASREVFAIQDEISLAIAKALGFEVRSGQRRYEPDPQVYQEFLKASGLRSSRNPANAARAAIMFTAIVAKDPEFARAWAELASAAANATLHQPKEEMPEVDPRMEPAALRAIQIDSRLAEAHAAMGNVYGRNRDWVNARRSFETAIGLNPSLTSTYTDFVLAALMPMGRTLESLQRLEEARRVGPVSLDVRRLLSQVQVNAGLHAEAIENARWVLERDPKFPYAEIFLARALLFAGQPEEALELFQNAESEGNWGYVGYLYAVTGRRREAEALAARDPEAAARQMLIYGGLGDKDRAFDALERTAAVNWWRAATWMIRPEMRILRGDPRVTALRQRLGLPPLEDGQ